MRSLFRSFTAGKRRLDKTPLGPSRSEDPCSALIVGLGNPGKEYAQNRHNVGFWCVNRLAHGAGADFGRRGRLATVAEGILGERHVALAKPRTFVNNSGEAIRELMKRYRLKSGDLIVICDDLDLPPGALRIRERGGHGGHNGLRSIIACIGTDDFPRVRIGIGRPWVDGLPTREPERVAAHVLADPPSGERRELDARVEDAVTAVQVMLAEGVSAAMGRYNTVRDS